MSIKEYITKNGKKTYYFTTYLGLDPMTGKKKVATRRGFKTKKEARSALAKLQLEWDSGTYEKSTKTTYKDVYKLWLDLYKEDVVASTFNSTVQIFEDHVLPVIGDLRVDRITSVLCQKLHNDLVGKYKTGPRMYSYASKCYQYAISPLGLIKENPFNNIYRKPVKREKPKYNFLEISELKNMLECIKESEDYKWYAFFTLVGFTGLRKSEALALNWSDLEGNRLTVSKTMTRDYNNSYVVGDTTKTQAGLRTITLDSETLKVLTTWKSIQKIKSINGIMFPNELGKYIVHSKPLRVLDRVNEKYGLKRITIHDLRRTHICHLFDAGIGIKEVQERVGQSDLKTTMGVYNFMTEYRKNKAVDKLENYING